MIFNLPNVGCSYIIYSIHGILFEMEYYIIVHWNNIGFSTRNSFKWN